MTGLGNGSGEQLEKKIYRGVLIGCGFFARNQLAAWQEIERVSIAAVCDINLDHAKRFADAVALHTLATTFFPQSYRAQGRLGDAQRAAGDSTAALASYRRALQLNPRATAADSAAATATERKISGPP